MLVCLCIYTTLYEYHEALVKPLTVKPLQLGDLVELPPVLANGGVKNEAYGGRGPRSTQCTKSGVAVSNLLS
jgi:hypothetical protein